ncbi:MAG: electron transfer flavoprotein subunit alpha/FixB family protein [Clostridia bacterium]|nr:electron transfer flavoprotein subunit alpha/FixB family protein [Clostridia bacterium]MBQ9785700.1 electron transfer flavoprotein subunit alpha/FixB family protein [Clostridia bacterium]
MSQLVINQNAVTPENAAALEKLCPFGAIHYENGKLDISSACKMCKLCVRKSGGVITYVEEAAATTLDKSLWRGVCVYADHTAGKLHRVTLELCGKAKELAQVTGDPVYAIMIGHDLDASAKRLLHYGVDRVFVYDHPSFADFRVEPYTAAFCDFIERYKPSSILVGATNLGRQLAPRVAARCRTGLTADCTVLEMKENSDLVQIRPAFGGNIMAQIVTPNTRPQFCTVRYKIFEEPVPTEEARGEIVRMSVSDAMLRSGIEVLDTREKPRDVDIADAEVIVAVGRGASGEGMRAYAEELAVLLGGMVACTRPLVESNLYGAKHQIGLSGRTVKPKLIICLGISGAVQFAAGMRSSDCIVAVNSDPQAPIFDVAHVCIPGDVNEIVPMLIEKIKEARHG